MQLSGLLTICVWVMGGQVTAASLMSHCLAFTNVDDQGSLVYWEQATADCRYRLLCSRPHKQDQQAPLGNVCTPGMSWCGTGGLCDVIAPLALIWYCCEQAFRLGAQRIEQEVEGVNGTNYIAQDPSKEDGTFTLGSWGALKRKIIYKVWPGLREAARMVWGLLESKSGEPSPGCRTKEREWLLELGGRGKWRGPPERSCCHHLKVMVDFWSTNRKGIREINTQLYSPPTLSP